MDDKEYEYVPEHQDDEDDEDFYFYTKFLTLSETRHKSESLPYPILVVLNRKLGFSPGI
jgi:hypothetical protein